MRTLLILMAFQGSSTQIEYPKPEACEAAKAAIYQQYKASSDWSTQVNEVADAQYLDKHPGSTVTRAPGSQPTLPMVYCVPAT